MAEAVGIWIMNMSDAFLLGGFSYQKMGQQIRETGSMQQNAQGDSGEQENTDENVETEKEKKKIALTFDDGPHPVYTPEMLDLLKEKRCQGYLFPVRTTGREVSGYRKKG